GERRRAAGNARERHEDLRDLAEAVLDAERAHDVWDVVIDRRVENPVAAAHHRLVVSGRVPGEGDARGEVVLVGVEVSVLRVQLVAQRVVDGEVRSRGPGVLPVKGREGRRVGVNGVV